MLSVCLLTLLSAFSFSLTQDQLNVTQDQFNVTQDQLNVTQDQLSLTQDQLSLTQDQLNVTQDQLNVTQDQLNVTQDQLSLTQDQLSLTQDQLNVTQDQLNVTQDQLNGTQDQLNVTQDQLNVTQDQLNVTQDQLNVTQDQLSLTQDQLNVTQDQLNVTQDQLNVTQDQLSLTQDQLSLTQDQLNVTQDQLNVTQDQLNGTQDQLSLTQDQLNVTQDQLSLTQDQLSLTQDQLSLTQDQLNGTLNEPQQERVFFSGYFGFRNLSGLRSFIPEQELESRIIGGQEAWANSWPWQVSLRFASRPACGGAVIGPTWVISAAHCFKRYKKASFWTVLAGKHDLDNPHEPRQQLVGVSVISNHPDYNTRTKESDLALLELQQPLVFNRFVRPIDFWMAPLTPNRKCTITGWGSTRENGARVNRLQEVNVTILPPRACNQYYHGRMRPSMFCAGKDTGGVDACQGDSGGPLTCFTGSRYELAGLVSWGVGCGRARRPGVYTKIQQHTSWITDIMNQVITYADDIGTEDSCGKKPRSSCEEVPGLASVSVSQEGVVSVGNMTESCPSSWPWMTSLQADGHHYCSGVLIHPRWVLTAQHCNVRAKEDVVALGVHDLRFSSSQTIPVDEVFNLQQDGSFPPNADLALLRLSVPARLGSDVSAVCVPDEEEDEDLDSSWSCVTTGWGSSRAAEAIDPERLHHVELTLVNQTTCREKWGGLITDSHICSHPAGSASCMGDSGAPLLCRRRGAYFLFGVVTWGSRRCDADKPAVFSRISDRLSWISDVTGDQ